MKSTSAFAIFDTCFLVSIVITCDDFPRLGVEGPFKDVLVFLHKQYWLVLFVVG